MIRLAMEARDESVRSVARLMDGGTLELFDGIKPGGADDPVTGQRILAEVSFQNPAFHNPENGIALAKKMDDVQAMADGMVRWFRCRTADGVVVLTGSLDDSEMDIRLNVREVLKGARVTVQTLILEQPEG
ncbi:MAG: hypothetical protein ACREI9_12445 [Nitrospiraceae bacterium]